MARLHTSLPESIDITSCVKQVHDNITEDSEWLSFFSDVKDTTDIIAAVRTSLLPYIIEMQDVLHSLEVTGEEAANQLNWLKATSIKISQDLAFNWDVDAQYSDREYIFTHVLPGAARIALNGWIKASFPVSIPVSSDSIWKSMPALAEIIEDQPVGYDCHPEKNLAWVKKKITEHLSEIEQSYTWSHTKSLPSLRLSMRSRLISLYQDVAIQAWIASSDNMMNTITQMTEEEIESWMASPEGSEPMEFSCYTVEFDSIIAGHGGLLLSPSFDLDGASQAATDIMGIAWGIADSAFQIQSDDEDAPEAKEANSIENDEAEEDDQADEDDFDDFNPLDDGFEDEFED
jgi:hypothetical protein